MASLEYYKTFTGESLGRQDRSYVISTADAKIVDFAIKLGKPLLVEGEAGCGKTCLADAVAHELELGSGEQKGRAIPLPVKSTSKANDLLYRYDALSRLQDSQASGERAEKSAYAYKYIHLEPLGRAIFEGQQCVILIDEVDKADMDFANDLLYVLDRFEFLIDEMPEAESEACKNDPEPGFGFERMVKGPKGMRPIVIFTSNRDKQLPKPFLRRCFYLELMFPEDPETLSAIVDINLKRRAEEDLRDRETLANLSPAVIKQAVDAFLAVRRVALQKNMTKPPSTAELIDWLHALHWEPPTLEKLTEVPPPHWRLLFSTVMDNEIYKNHLSGQ